MREGGGEMQLLYLVESCSDIKRILPNKQSDVEQMNAVNGKRAP